MMKISINVSRMVTKQFRVVSMFSALALMGLQAISHADTSTVGHAQVVHQIVQTNSTISEDSKSSLTISLSVVQTIPADPAVPVLINGSIIVGGHLGTQGFTLNAIPSFFSVFNETFASTKVQHVQIISRPFSYLDLNSLTRVPAWISMDLTKGSDGTQLMGFHIFNAVDNSLIVQSWNPASPRLYAQLPLVLGSMFFRF